MAIPAMGWTDEPAIDWLSLADPARLTDIEVVRFVGRAILPPAGFLAGPFTTLLKIIRPSFNHLQTAAKSHSTPCCPKGRRRPLCRNFPTSPLSS
jgi:hypothetical protein